MRTLFSASILRLGTIFVFGLAFWAAVGAIRAHADDQAGCEPGCDAYIWGFSEARATRPVVRQHRRDRAAATDGRGWTLRHVKPDERYDQR